MIEFCLIVLVLRSFVEELDRKRIKHLASTVQDILLAELKHISDDR